MNVDIHDGSGVLRVNLRGRVLQKFMNNLTHRDILRAMSQYEREKPEVCFILYFSPTKV